MKPLKKLSIMLLGLVLLIGTIFYTCNAIIKSQSEAYISYDIHQLPPQKVGLLLGTSKTLKNGYKNYYFYNRIDAAEALYKSKKIQYLIVSGDNSRKNYNEPEDMKLELIARGIPTDRIFEDFAGFRTLDSVVRAKEIFGQKQFIVISQKFHNERAVFLARRNGIAAYGYNAPDVTRYAGMKTQIREYFARVKVFVDFLIGKEPKFGGKKIVIPN